MNVRVGRLIRREAGRARALAIPAVLLAVLSVFALVHLPSANTAWTQQVSLGASVGTGSFSCSPYAVAYAGAHESGGNTTYSYTLTGGGANPITCKSVASVALPVCFNPALVGGGGLVISESHPLTPTGWGYTPDTAATPKLARWSVTATDVGAGPFTALNGTFTFTLAGTGIPLDATAIAQVLTSGATTPAAAGTVSVPKPAICSPRAATLRTSALPKSGSPGSLAPVPSASPSPSPSPTVAAPSPDPPHTRSGNGAGAFIAGPNATSKTPPKVWTPTPSPIGTAEYGP